MAPSLGYDGLPQDVHCECCAPRMVTFTVSSGHKWTEEEIRENILWRAKELAEASWYNRAERVRSLKHWLAKLERLQAFREEFVAL